MEYVEGKPLSELIPAEGLSPENVIRYGIQIADALAHAHEHGIVHRDLKSQNVVVTPEGRAKVLDFGVADRVPQIDAEAVTKAQEFPSRSSRLVGTLAYMAPEVLRGEAALARSDIWALGVLLYEMASGRLPFDDATGADIASAILKETPSALPSKISPGLRSIVQRCLSKEAKRRYSNGEAVQAALEAIHSDVAAPTMDSMPTKPSRRYAVWASVALVAVALMYLARSSNFGIESADRSSIPRLINARQVTRAIGQEDQGVVARRADARLRVESEWEAGHLVGTGRRRRAHQPHGGLRWQCSETLLVARRSTARVSKRR